LEQVVLRDIRRIVRYASVDEEAFARLLMETATQKDKHDNTVRQAKLADMQKRDEEIDRLIKKIYEDNALDKVSDERMVKLMSEYENEQVVLCAQIDRLEAAILDAADKCASVEQFVEMVKQHTIIKRLTAPIVNRFVDHIVVHQAEKVAGGYVQRIDIYYNCIGTIDLPETVEAPLPKVDMKTRKGVVLSYASISQAAS
jgi:hypothetical protein